MEEKLSAGDAIRIELEKRGWTHDDLAAILGRPRPVLTNIILGKTAITPTTAQELAEAFGTSAEYWMRLDASTRLAQAENPAVSIQSRARIYGYAPIREMQKRGWIPQSDDFQKVEDELRRFFMVQSLEEAPTLEAALRSSRVEADEARRAQIAWCYRCLFLASTIRASAFNSATLRDALPELRKLAARPQLAAEVPRALRELGVRLVVVEHLAKTKIDGAALWIEQSPIIGMSLRYDRIDYFWHTLFHEIFHILNKDGYRVDLNTGEAEDTGSVDTIEERANTQAADVLIPIDALESFIRRVSPFYRKERIIQFANLHKIHPGIVLGQLQHRKEISWKANKEFLVGVREHIKKTSMVDGWGCTISGGQ